MRNRNVKSVREICEAYGVDCVEEALNAIQKIQDPNDRAGKWLKMMEYIYAKRRAIEITEKPYESEKVSPDNVEELHAKARARLRAVNE